jgi:hypothetical protein
LKLKDEDFEDFLTLFVIRKWRGEGDGDHANVETVLWEETIIISARIAYCLDFFFFILFRDILLQYFEIKREARTFRRI